MVATGLMKFWAHKKPFLDHFGKRPVGASVPNPTHQLDPNIAR